MAIQSISTAAIFNQTRDAICRRALRLIGAISSGETPDAMTMQDCADALNAMTKEWMASGLHLWTETEGTIFPQPGQVQYPIGSGSVTLAVNQPTSANLTLAAAVGALVISVVPPLGTLVGNTLLVQNLNGGWSSGIITAVGTTTVTLASPGLAVGCAALAAAFTWPQSALMARPLRILSLRRYNLLSGVSVPLTMLARLDFRDLPNQQYGGPINVSSSTPGNWGGLINSWFYDPQLTFGQLWCWLSPQSPIGDILNITYMRPLMDWTSPGNVGDFPQEWLSTIAYNLAVEIAPEYQIPASQYQMLLQLAAAKIDTLKGWDKEPESIFFGAAMEQGWSR